jgi:HK97 family phage portal protein
MWPFGKRTQDRALWQVGDIYPPGRYLADRSGVPVTPDTALRLSAVWGCVRLLADVVSELPVHVFAKGTRDEVDPPPVLVTPAAGTDLPDWLWQHMISYLLRGNVMGLVVDRVGLTRPSQVELVNPDRVTPQVDQGDQSVTWRLDGREIDTADLWHRRAYPVPGQPLGLSPIGYAAGSIGLGLAAQDFGAKFFADDGTPTGVLTSDMHLTSTQADEISARWRALRSGDRRTAVLGSNLKYQAISIPPEESQFLETQKFGVQQICRLYGVPPEMVASDSGASMTYANVESRDLSLLKYSVQPWLGRLERAMNTLLPRAQYCKFNTAALLRSDLASRYSSYAIGLDNGFLTVDEVRELEDREPLPPEIVGSRKKSQIGAVA